MPEVLVADMAEARQGDGVDLRVVIVQQVNHGVEPDILYLFLFNEQLPPGAVLDVEAVADDGEVDVRVLIELAIICVQGAEYADLNALCMCPLQHGVGGTAKQVIEQGPVVVKERPEQVWHGKSDVLPFAVGQNVLLLSRLHAAGAACL